MARSEVKKIIGLYGGSGAGKSMVASILEERGAARIDADRISREVSRPGGSAYAGLREAFPEYFDEEGELQRRKLGELVFSDPRELERLESITHPAMRDLMAQRIREAPEEMVVVDCAILTKPIFRGLVDELWMVQAQEEKRVRRIMERDGIAEESARARLEAQENADTMARWADRIILNDGGPEDVAAQLDRMNDGKEA